MTWLNWLGVGLQVVGLLWAMWILARLRETVTGREVNPLRWFRSWWRWLRRVGSRLVGRKPRTHYASAHLAGGIGIAGNAHAVVTKGPLPTDRDLAGQIEWLDGYVRDLERRHNELSTKVFHEAADRDRAVNDARKAAEERIREAVEEVRAEFRDLVGADVAWEAGSLLLVAIGVVLAAV